MDKQDKFNLNISFKPHYSYCQGVRIDTNDCKIDVMCVHTM